VPARLRAEGLVVHVMADVYPDLDTLEDVVWIREQTALGRVLLTKDRQIRRNEAEKEAVKASRARMFTIPKASLTGPQMADRLARNRHRIVQRSRRSGPYIYLVHDPEPRAGLPGRVVPSQMLGRRFGHQYSNAELSHAGAATSWA
jgi:hypothetical protein